MNKKKGFTKSSQALDVAHQALVQDITDKFKEGEEHTIDLLPNSTLRSRTIYVERVGEDLMVRDENATIRHPIRELAVDFLMDIRDAIMAGMVDVIHEGL